MTGPRRQSQASNDPELVLKRVEQMKRTGKFEELTRFQHFLLFLKNALNAKPFGVGYVWMAKLLGVVTMMQFISSTYIREDNERGRDLSDGLEIAFSLILAFDWILHLIIAESTIDYILSFDSIVTIIVSAAVFSTYTLEFVPYTRLSNLYEVIKYLLFLMKRFRILSAFQFNYFFQFIPDLVERKIATISLIIGVYALFFAAVIQYLESQGQPLSFHTWLYFVWVTLSTVGYGDIAPISTLGRIAVMIFITIAIAFIPRLISDLLTLMNLQTAHSRAAYNPRSKTSQHIIICGNLLHLSYRDILAQIFHEDHHRHQDLTVVILAPEPPSPDLQLLIRSRRYPLVYLEGSPFSERDLQRARLDTASAIFLMSGKFINNVDAEDARTILLNIRMKQFITSHSANPATNAASREKLLCLQLHRKQNRRHLYDDDFIEMMDHDLIVCFNEIKLGVMAKSVISPGIAAFLLNLVTSFSTDELIREHERFHSTTAEQALIPQTQTTVSGRTVKVVWKQEYLAGCEWEIYITSLPSTFAGIKFSKLSAQLYEKLGIILFALQITDLYHGDYSRLILNPADYIIPGNDNQYRVEAFVIARDQAQSDFAAIFGLKDTGTTTAAPKSGFYIPEGYTVNDQQMLMPARPPPPKREESTLRRAASSLFSGLSQRLSGRQTPASPSTKAVVSPSSKAPPPSLAASAKSQKNISFLQKWQNLKRTSLLTKGVYGITYEETYNRLQHNHLYDHYYTRSSPVALEQITIQNQLLEEEITFSESHLIIIGKVSFHWYELIKPLRAKYLGSLRPIVLVSPSPMPNDVWQRIQVFDQVYFIQGSPLEEINLVRAGIFRASQVIILADAGATHYSNTVLTSSSNNTSSSGGSSTINPEEMVDADAIFTYHFVARLNPSIEIILEILHPKNVTYLDRNLQASSIENYLFSPQFANGLLFPTSLLDSIACQTYFNPAIVRVLSKLLAGPEEYNRIDMAIDASKLLVELSEQSSQLNNDNNFASEDLPKLLKEDSSVRSIRGSSLYTMKVTEEMTKQPYIQVYRQLSSQGIIPLAILRGVIYHSTTQIGPLGNHLPYVYTNPSSNAPLFECDSLFVLSTEPILDRMTAAATGNGPLSDGGQRRPHPIPYLSPQKSSAAFFSTTNSAPFATPSKSALVNYQPMNGAGDSSYTSDVILQTLAQQRNYFDETLRQFMQQLNQQTNQKMDAVNQSMKRYQQEILSELQQQQQQAMQWNLMQSQANSNNPKSDVSAKEKEETDNVTTDETISRNNINPIPTSLFSPSVMKVVVREVTTQTDETLATFSAASTKSRSTVTGFVNNDDELLNQQKAYEMRYKPSFRIFQQPKVVFPDAGGAAAGPMSSNNSVVSNASTTTNKKVFGKEASIVGPTINDLTRTKSRYQRHPNLLQEQSGGASLYDNNGDDVSLIGDDDNSTIRSITSAAPVPVFPKK